MAILSHFPDRTDNERAIANILYVIGLSVLSKGYFPFPGEHRTTADISFP